jgi:aryl sulfotransferase
MAEARQPDVRRVYQNHHLDSTRWDDFKPRRGDIVISTSYKAGTTLTQTIVLNLLFPEGPPATLGDLSPWLDARFGPVEEVLGKLEAQTHRRCIKTHLAFDGLRLLDEAQYVMVGRDPRDVFMSLVNHYSNHTPEFFPMLNDQPGLVGDPFPPYGGDIHEFWASWISRGWFAWESDGYPYWSHLHHAKTWWEARHRPNVRLIHYADLRRDLEGEMRALAAWLGIEVPEDRWPAVVHACRFETVKANPEKLLGDQKMIWKGGGQTFINQGVNGRWQGVLTEAELAQYAQAMRSLPPDCARWLETGGAYD